MESDTAKSFVKILDPLTMEILQMAVSENLYPNQIAGRIDKSNSLVVKRLKELARHGIIKGRFETKDGKAVRKYELLSEKLSLEIDFKENNIRLRNIQKSTPLRDIVRKHPTLFESYESYILWSKGKVNIKDLSKLLKLSPEEAEEIARNVRENVDEVFTFAFQEKLERWEDGHENTYLHFVDDYMVIPTQRIKNGLMGIDKKVISRLREGEILLSTLQKEVNIPDLKKEIEELERHKIIILEERGVIPKIAFERLNSVMDQSIHNGDTFLRSIGRETGYKLASFLQLPPRDIIEMAFGKVEMKRSGHEDIITLCGCKACVDVPMEKVGPFVAGAMEGILEKYQRSSKVKVKTLKVGPQDVCAFTIESKIKPEFKIKGAERVSELLR